jgi:4-amino-4-deoxy-L-arabinose transferase-like glycosyltransferase
MSTNAPQLQAFITVVTVVLTVWTIPWKGWALWRAARRGEKKWFIAMLILNTVAILEILYIFVFSKDRTAKASEAPSQPPTALL